MKRRIRIAAILLVLLVVTSCIFEPRHNASNTSNVKYGREYWGEWEKMDQSETWLINSTSIWINGVELTDAVSLLKSSENVINVTKNGITDCLYAIRTASSSISGTVTTDGSSRAINGGYLSVIMQNIDDANDRIETTTDANGSFKADQLIVGEKYNVKVGNTSLSVSPSFDGEDIGTITLTSGVNFKVTVSNSKTEMYAGIVYYPISVEITNVGDANCTAATYTLEWDDGLDVINNYEDGFLLRTIAVGETKTIPVLVRCDSLEVDSVQRKLRLTIKDIDNKTWNDSVALKFYRDSAIINVVSENDRPISGVIIGGGNTYSLTGKTNYSLDIPVISENYLMVFSGAIANASKNTECIYSVGINTPAVSASALNTQLGTDTGAFEPNNDETNAKMISSGESIVSYLHENDVDYYSCLISEGSQSTALNDDSSEQYVNYNKDILSALYGIWTGYGEIPDEWLSN